MEIKRNGSQPSGKGQAEDTHRWQISAFICENLRESAGQIKKTKFQKG